jgi:hypothetical protein
MDWCLCPPLLIDEGEDEMVDLAVKLPCNFFRLLTGAFFTPRRFFGLEWSEPDKLKPARILPASLHGMNQGVDDL